MDRYRDSEFSVRNPIAIALSGGNGVMTTRYNRQMKSDGNEHLGEVVHCGRMMIYLSDRIPEF